MPTPYKKIWIDYIINPLRDILKRELGSSVNIYTGRKYKEYGNQAIRITPRVSRLEKEGTHSVLDEYVLNLTYYHRGDMENETLYNKFLNTVDHIKATLVDEKNQTPPGFFRMQTKEVILDDPAFEDENIKNSLVARFELTCLFHDIRG